VCVCVIIGKLLQSVDILAHTTARRQSILCYCFVIVQRNSVISDAIEKSH